MTAIDAVIAAGWLFLPGWGLWPDSWISTDWEAILNLIHPPRYSGTAREVCLAHGIWFTEPLPSL